MTPHRPALREPEARGPQGPDRLSHGRRSLARPHAGAGGGAGARRRRPDRAGRAVLRSDRRRAGDPARRRARAQGGHHAATRARDRARRSAPASEVPLLLFTYLNPVMRYGLERLAADAAACGIDGCLLIDAIGGRGATTMSGAMHRHGLDTVFLAAPTSTERRLQLVARVLDRLRLPGLAHGRDRRAGFALGHGRAAGRGGARGDGSAAGGGLRHLASPSMSRELGRQVEAVVVGSAIVRLIEQNADDPALETPARILHPRAEERLRSACMTQDEARAQARRIPRARSTTWTAASSTLLNERTRVVERSAA